MKNFIETHKIESICILAALCAFVAFVIVLRARYEEPAPVETPVKETVDISEVEFPFENWASGKTLLGIDIPEVAEAIEYEMYFEDEDITAAAQMMLGEAGCDWISDHERMACLWTVLNRVDSWGGTIKGQITSENQYLGYSPYLPATEYYKGLATDVLTRWSLEKQGVDISRELPPEYLWFSANKEGTHNIFRDKYLFQTDTNYIIFE